MHQEIIHEASDSNHRDRLLDDTNAAFARLKSQSEAWTEEITERGAWDETVADGQVGE